MSESGTIELPRAADPYAGLGGRWRVIVLNDDHNTFDHDDDPDDEFVFGLERVLDGVEALVARRAPE